MNMNELNEPSTSMPARAPGPVILDLQHISLAFGGVKALTDISFDVRGGLLLRQMHHWAALIFIAAMAVHMFRVFFTGAFRKPREGNWVIGVVLFLLAVAAGFSGYSLPDDLLSGTGLRITQGIIQATPVIGTWTLRAPAVTLIPCEAGPARMTLPLMARLLPPLTSTAGPLEF